MVSGDGTIKPDSAAIKPDETRARSATASLPLWSRKPGKETKCNYDIEWPEACGRCIEKGLRCYTQAGTAKRAKSCQHCRHVKNRPPCPDKQEQLPAVSGPIRQTELRVTRKRASRSKEGLKERAERAKRAPPKTPRIRLENGQYAPSPSESSSTQPAPSNKRRQRLPREGPKEKQNLEAAERAEQAQQQQIAGTSTTAALRGRVALHNGEQQAQSGEAVLEGAAAVDEDSPLPRAMQIGGPVETAEASSGSVPTLYDEEFIVDLVKNISASIRRCLELMAQASNRAGLSALETTFAMFVDDLDEVLASKSSALGSSHATHLILPRLRNHLSRVVEESKRISDLSSVPDSDEKEVKVFSAVIFIKALFEKCLSLDKKLEARE